MVYAYKNSAGFGVNWHEQKIVPIKRTDFYFLVSIGYWFIEMFTNFEFRIFPVSMEMFWLVSGWLQVGVNISECLKIGAGF